jgi:hypothetical protein
VRSIQRLVRRVADDRHVAHLSALEHTALPVHVDVRGRVAQGVLEPEQLRGPVLARPEEVDHRSRPVRRRRAEWQPADRPHVLLELGGHGAFDRPVARVVHPRRQLVDEDAPARQQEQLDRQQADDVEPAGEPAGHAHRITDDDRVDRGWGQ